MGNYGPSMWGVLIGDACYIAQLDIVVKKNKDFTSFENDVTPNQKTPHWHRVNPTAYSRYTIAINPPSQHVDCYFAVDMVMDYKRRMKKDSQKILDC